MKYYGKRFLYNFLQEHGYDVNALLKDYCKEIKMKDFYYTFFRGTEWLKSLCHEIEIYSPCRRVVYVQITKTDDETGEEICAERSKYIDGILDYQTKYGEITILCGKPYKKITA